MHNDRKVPDPIAGRAIGWDSYLVPLKRSPQKGHFMDVFALRDKVVSDYRLVPQVRPAVGLTWVSLLSSGGPR